MSSSYGVDWPDGFGETPPDERSSANKFSTGFQRTKRDVRKEFERMGVDRWHLDDESGSGGFPGVVLRWTTDGVDYAIACDAYTDKSSNLRAAYLWLKETRMRSDRPVETGQTAFAAAQLPSGEDGDAIAVAPDGSAEAPHELLGLAPDAPDDVVRAAARRLAANVHPDKDDGDEAEFKRIQNAKEAMLDGE